MYTHTERDRVILEVTFFPTILRFHTPCLIFDQLPYWTATTWFTYWWTFPDRILTSSITRSTFRIVDLTLEWAFCYEGTMKFMLVNFL